MAPAPARRAAQRRGRIAALRRIEMMGADVVDAGEHEQGAVVLQYHVLILEHRESEPSNLARPRTLARVILVIARDEECAMARGERWKRRRVAGQLLDRSVDQVAGDRDEIGFQIIHARDQALDEAAADGRADVHVADLSDGEAVQRLREPRDGNVDVHQTRPAREEEADPRE